MSARTIRWVLRFVHLVLGVCVAAVVYLPPGWTEPLRLALGAGVVPLLVLSGLALWQQGRLRRLLGRDRRHRQAESP